MLKLKDCIKLFELFDTPEPITQKVFSNNTDKYFFHIKDRNGNIVRYEVRFSKHLFNDDTIVADVGFAQITPTGEKLQSTLGDAQSTKIFSIVWRLIEKYLKLKKSENIQLFTFSSTVGASASRNSLYKRFAKLINDTTDWKLIDDSGTFVFINKDYYNNNKEYLNQAGYKLSNNLTELSRKDVIDNYGGPVSTDANVYVRLRDIDEKNKYINFVCVDRNSARMNSWLVRLKMADFRYLKNDRDLSDQHKVELALLDGDLKYSCNCPSFKLGGFAYISGVHKASLIKEPRRPVKNNPREEGIACKHITAVMEQLESFVPKITQEFARFHKR